MAHGKCALLKAGQTHFSGCFSSPQCKQKLGQPLPFQYALELLTVYAWERGSKEADFVMAQGFRTVLELVVDYRKLCIYWTKYYDINHSVIGPYLRRQLQKPRYPIPTGPSPPQRWTPPPRGALDMRKREAPFVLVTSSLTLRGRHCTDCFTEGSLER